MEQGAYRIVENDKEWSAFDFAVQRYDGWPRGWTIAFRSHRIHECEEYIKKATTLPRYFGKDGKELTAL